MCGIAGLWRLAGSRDLAAQSRAMTDAIAYRGPDGDGHWTDPAAGIALGHRRLAIIDLTPTGLAADDERGRPHRHHLQRRALQPRRDGGGARPAVARDIGHRGAGRGDRERSASTARSRAPTACSPSRPSTAATRTLHLARDRLGIKPLYWTRQNGALRVRVRAQGAARRRRPRASRSIPARSRAICATPACRRRARSFARSPSSRPATVSRCSAAGVDGAALLGRRRRRAARPAGAATAGRSRRSSRNCTSCWPTRSSGRWCRTCRSARSCPAASIPRPWSR